VTLAITVLAAIAVTAVRFTRPALGDRWRLGLLALILWGASLMWVVDLVAVTLAGDAFVDLSDRAAVLDDALLGVSVLALALAVWTAIRLIGRRKRAAATRLA